MRGTSGLQRWRRQTGQKHDRARARTGRWNVMSLPAPVGWISRWRRSDGGEGCGILLALTYSLAVALVLTFASGLPLSSTRSLLS